MKHLSIVFLLLIGQFCFANMASPLREGTFSSSAFTSRNIDILNEKIYIKLEKDFNSALFKIEYKVKANTDGRQIPLLFHAVDYKGDFKVWVDDQLVTILPIPEEYQSISNSPFQRFSTIFNEQKEVTICWEENSGFIYNLNDLKYFETSLEKGEHTIRIEYFATSWLDKSQWLNNYSFRYSLSPAKFWKSFGSLEITLDASKFKNKITTNFGKPTYGRLDSISFWKFNELPGNYLQIDFVPKLNKSAETLISIGTIKLTLIFALLISILHLILIRFFRSRNKQKVKSWVMIVGSIFVPFAILLFNMYSYDIIDWTIGDEASHYHGYTFFVLVLYPILMPMYWLVMRFIDKHHKKKMLSSGL